MENQEKQEEQEKQCKNQQENFWDDFSLEYNESLSSSLSALTISMLTMLQVEKSNKILEVAVGPGYQVPYLLQRKKPEALLYLTDFSSQFLSITKQRIENFLTSKYNEVYNMDYKQIQPFQGTENFEKINTILQKANSENLSEYKDNTFDTYISSLCLNHTNDHEKMIKEAYRVLSPGGKACFSVWGEEDRTTLELDAIVNYLKQIGFDTGSNKKTPFHLNNRQKLIKMFEYAGFTDTLCWDQLIPINFVTDKKSAEQAMEFYNIKKLLGIIPEEKKEEAKQVFTQAFLEVIQERKQPITLDTLVIMVTKPKLQ